MSEIPNAHPGAPLTLWIRRSDGGYYRTMLDPPESDAVEYIRKDAADAMLTHEANTPQRVDMRDVVRGALEALEDDDEACATAILRTCLSRL